MLQYFTVTSDTFQISHQLNRISLNYLKFKFCEKQYVGETKDAFRLQIKTMTEKVQRYENCIFMSSLLRRP